MTTSHTSGFIHIIDRLGVKVAESHSRRWVYSDGAVSIFSVLFNAFSAEHPSVGCQTRRLKANPRTLARYGYHPAAIHVG